jgi:hypothetical protein
LTNDAFIFLCVGFSETFPQSRIIFFFFPFPIRIPVPVVLSLESSVTKTFRHTEEGLNLVILSAKWRELGLTVVVAVAVDDPFFSR